MPKGLPPILLQTVRRTLDEWREFIDYLQIPQWVIYRGALRDAVSDIARAFRSSGHLFLLTFRPLFLFGVLVGSYLILLLKYLAKHGWIILQIVGKQLFYHAYVSARKSSKQLQTAVRWFIRFQQGLSRASICMEVGAIVAVILLYLLRRHIVQQKYVARMKSSYKRTKRRMLQSYQRTVHRIAKVSLFLAMLLPHVIFGSFVVAFKFLFSSVLHWLACETYATSLINWWYPLFCTIATTYQLRTLLKGDGNDQSTESDDDSSPTKESLATTEASQRRGTKTGIFPHTTPRRAETRPPGASPIQRWMKNKESSSESVVTEQAQFWLSYWVVYMVFMAIARLGYLTPIFGRIFYKSSFWKSVAAEFQFIFFLWIFGLPTALTNSTKTDKDFEKYEARPLQLLLGRLSPTLISFHEQVSHAVPPAYWDQVLARSRNVLDLLVLVRLISKDTQEWLLHVVEEAQSLVLPSITLLMPGFLTGYGVVYVQSIAPAAKSCKALSYGALDKVKLIQINLEYWILNLLLAAFLEWLSPLLWWVPLSTHVIYLLWCHLSLPKTIETWYEIFDQELQAFGILPRDENMKISVEETRTARFLRAVAEKLPSAVGNSKENDHQGGPATNGSREDETFSDALTQPGDEATDDKYTPLNAELEDDFQMPAETEQEVSVVAGAMNLSMDDSYQGEMRDSQQETPTKMHVVNTDEEREPPTPGSLDTSSSRLRRSTRTRRRPNNF